MTDSGPAIPLAVFMTASGHGGGRCFPLSASGMGSAAGEPGVRCRRVWGRDGVKYKYPNTNIDTNTLNFFPAKYKYKYSDF